jgi:glucose uptake protein
MILPGSQLLNLILLALGMLCLGSWANTFRMASKWRFELYAFDFAVGAVLASVLIGLTFGSLGWDGFALTDDLRVAAKQKDALAMLAGAVFNLGNMLMLGGLSIAGITAAYMIGVSLMFTSGIVIMHFTSPSGNRTMLIAGALLLVTAAVLLGVASRIHSLERLVIQMREGKTKSTKKVVSIKGIVLIFLGGLVASGFFPLVTSAARESESGAGPYAIGIFFAIGIAISTFVYGLFFMNLPVQGDPLELTAYFKGRAKFHWLGIAGGVLFYFGLISLLIVARADGKNVLPLFTVRALMLAAALIGTLWGLLKWNDFANAGGRVKTILLIAVFVFLVGMAGLSASAGISTAG